jgi:hypothetical protein
VGCAVNIIPRDTRPLTGKQGDDVVYARIKRANSGKRHWNKRGANKIMRRRHGSSSAIKPARAVESAAPATPCCAAMNPDQNASTNLKVVARSKKKKKKGLETDKVRT